MKEKIMLTRRGFVAGAAAMGAAATLGFYGCAPSPTSNEPVQETEESADVVVVGGGFAGMMAAITLADHYPDQKVILLEQQDQLGGSLRYSDGFFSGFSDQYNTDPADCATAAQMAEMFTAAADDVVDSGYAVMETPLDEALTFGIYDEMPEVITELEEMGVPFQKPLDLNSPFSKGSYSDDVYAVATDGSGAGFSDAVVEHLMGTATDVRTGAQVTDLIVEDGTVVGVSVVAGKSAYDIKAKAVLLAMGGFAANSEKIEEHLPVFKNCMFSPNPGATGMALDFTEQFGTPLVSDGLFGGVVAEDESFLITACHFMVNEEGRRFADETQNWYLFLWAVAENTENAAGWCICDSDYVAANPEETQFKIEAGSLVEYATLEDLCKETGIDQAGLEETIASYNAAVDAGQDPEFGLPVDQANKVATAPFYAEKSTTFCFGTIKGLSTDDQCRVLSDGGSPVEGLYATGETAVGNVFFGQYPTGGSGNSFAGNSGRYAALSIVNNL